MEAVCEYTELGAERDKMILRMRIYVLHALFGLFGFSDDGEHKGR